MFTGIDINAARKFISKLDPDQNNPTVFHIGVLDPVLRAEVDDETSIFKVSSPSPDDKGDIKFKWSRRQLAAIKFGLKGLENFLDPQTNKPVELSFDTISYAGKMRQAVPDRIIAMLPYELRQELAEAILNESKLSGEEQKN